MKKFKYFRSSKEYILSEDFNEWLEDNPKINILFLSPIRFDTVYSISLLYEILDETENDILPKKSLKEDKYNLSFELHGADPMIISKNAGWSTGGKEGFFIEFKDNELGYVGGILEKEDAKSLAMHILNSLK